MVVAVYSCPVDTEDKCHSTIKFGSYDPINIKTGTKLNVLKTVGAFSWDLSSQYAQIGGATIVNSPQVRIDP